MESTYYNTTGESPEVCEEKLDRNEKQEQFIYDFFLQHPGQRFTPFEVLELTGINAPIWSVRRSMTNLTKREKLVKTSIRKMERLGSRNCTWELATEESLREHRKTRKIDALTDVLNVLVRKIKEDSTSNPSIVFSDDVAKQYRDILKGTIVANGYTELLPLVQ